jgi:hypothetical protein
MNHVDSQSAGRNWSLAYWQRHYLPAVAEPFPAAWPPSGEAATRACGGLPAGSGESLVPGPRSRDDPSFDDGAEAAARASAAALLASPAALFASIVTVAAQIEIAMLIPARMLINARLCPARSFGNSDRSSPFATSMSLTSFVKMAPPGPTAAFGVNRRPKRTPYRRAKGTPFVKQRDGYGGRTVRAGCGVGRA